jgi:hypothetical protein
VYTNVDKVKGDMTRSGKQPNCHHAVESPLPSILAATTTTALFSSLSATLWGVIDFATVAWCCWRVCAAILLLHQVDQPTATQELQQHVSQKISNSFLFFSKAKWLL